MRHAGGRIVSGRLAASQLQKSFGLISALVAVALMIKAAVSS